MCLHVYLNGGTSTVQMLMFFEVCGLYSGVRACHVYTGIFACNVRVGCVCVGSVSTFPGCKTCAVWVGVSV